MSRISVVLLHVILLFALSARCTLADTTDWPNWVEGDEFRAIRDQDRAGK